MRFCDELKLKYFCGSNVVWPYLLKDERRFEGDTKRAGEDPEGLNTNVFTHDVVDGPSWIPTQETKLREALKDPAAALDYLRHRDAKFWKREGTGKDARWRAIEGPRNANREEGPVPGVFIMRDLSLYMQSEEHFGLRRQLAEMCKANALSGFGRMLMLPSSSPSPHASIAEYCDIVDYQLPSYSEIEQHGVNRVWDTLRRGGHKDADWECEPALQDRITRSLMGMSCEEAERILSQSWTACGGPVTERMLDIIAYEKRKTIRKVRGLEYIPHADIPDMSQFGGYDQFIPWIDETAMCYLPEAALIGLEQPLGTALIGPAGTGKTTIAYALAKRLGLDALKIKLSQLFDSKVGGTEQLTDALFTMLKALPQVCAIFDEFEKGMGEAHMSQKSDAGVSARLLQAVLQLFSERDCNPDGNRMFVVLTMNRTGGIPAEAFRSGRLDRMWYAKLPTERECLDILKIHLQKPPRLIDPEHYGDAALMRVVKEMDRFSGADIEALVRQARKTAFCRQHKLWMAGETDHSPTREEAIPTIDELGDSTHAITRVAKMNESEIQELDKFCDDIGALPVSSEHVSDVAEVHDRGIRGTVGEPR